MRQADFRWVNFDHTFPTDGVTATRSFFIDDNPVAAGAGISADGYILIQARNVGGPSVNDDGAQSAVRVLINGRDLPSFDLVNHNGWTLWMDRIPEDFLRRGNNRITIRTTERCTIANVTVNWRELVSSGGIQLPDPVLVPNG